MQSSMRFPLASPIAKLASKPTNQPTATPPTPRWLLSLLLLGSLACTTAERSRTDRTPGIDAGPAAAASSSAPLAQDFPTALDHALTSGWKQLQMLAECQTEHGWTSVEVFGSGVGIWNGAKQFQLTPAQVQSLLTEFQTAGFARMPELFGGSPKPPSSGSAMRILCRASLTVDGVSKQSAQLDRGEQSAALKGLAHRLFELVAEPARSGIGVTDLQDGLTKLASGELAPEVLSLMLNRKPEGDADAEGSLLVVAGREAQARKLGAASELRTLALASGDWTQLATFLAQQELTALPVNLYAEDYTDFSVTVLNQEKKVQARQFAGMSPTQHGAAQAHFNAVIQELDKLYDRVLRSGVKTAE